LYGILFVAGRTSSRQHNDKQTCDRVFGGQMGRWDEFSGLQVAATRNWSVQG